MFNKKLIENLAFFGVLFVLFTLSFYDNFFKTANWPFLLNTRITEGHWHPQRDWFDTYELSSESLVVGRMVQSRKKGVTSEAFLMGRFHDTALPDDTNFAGYQYELLQHPSASAVYVPYLSQPGGSGTFFSLIDAAFGHRLTISAFHFINAMLTAAVLAGICIFFAKEFGTLAAIFAFMAIFLSGWITVAGRNLYWLIWTLYFPFLLVFYELFMECMHPKKPRFKGLCFMVFFALLFRFSCGFEYCTTVLISMTVPVFYFAIQYGWSFKTFCKRFAALSCVGLLSLLGAIGLWICQLSTIFEKSSSVLSFILYTVSKRTLPSSDNISTIFYDSIAKAENLQSKRSLALGIKMALEKTQTPLFLKSLECTVLDVLRTYLSRGFFVFVVLFGICVVLVLWRRRLSEYKALITATAVSLLAPLSWFVFAKAHCYIHTHLNFLLWFIPFILVVCAFMGKLVQEICSKPKNTI